MLPRDGSARPHVFWEEIRLMRGDEDKDVKDNPRPPSSGASAQQAFLVLGIPALGFGLGFAMIQINFWVGIGLMTLFVPLFWWLISRAFTEQEWIKRLVGVAGSIVIFGVILWAVWVPASVHFAFGNESVDHPSGSEINGIKWREDFSQLTVLIYNYGSADLRNLDIYITTDLLIAGAGIGPGLNTCSAEAVPANMTIGSMATIYTDSSGNIIEIPWTDQNKKIASSLYRIKCDGLASKSKIEIKLPILVKDWTRGEPKRQVRWAVLWVSYSAGYRPVHMTQSKCFTSPCNDMPTDKADVPLAIGLTESTTIH
jgi:hypothetical protein